MSNAIQESHPAGGPEEVCLDPEWRILERLGGRIHRKGFDRGKTLIEAQHEIRGMACRRFDESRHVVAAGDKLGRWHVAVFDARHLGAECLQNPVVQFSKREGPPCAGEDDRVIDAIEMLDGRDGCSVAIGTRGNGLWLVSLESAIEAPQGQPLGWTQLDGSAGRRIRKLLLDPAANTLWAAAEGAILCWSLESSPPRLLTDESLPFRINAFAIDEDPDGIAENDHLYLATNDFRLCCLGRSSQGTFEVSAESLARSEPIWKGRLSTIEHLWPLSKIRRFDRAAGDWVRRFTHRGVAAATLRHQMLIYRENDASGEASQYHCYARLVVAHSKVLAMGALNMPDWQGFIVSTLEGGARIFRPSGIRDPESDRYLPFESNWPEQSPPSALISGYKDIGGLDDRIYAICALEPIEDPSDSIVFLPIVLGMGNHQVRGYRFNLRWNLRRKSQDIAQGLVDRCASFRHLVASLQKRALQSPMTESEKHASVQLVPALGRACRADEDWEQLKLLIWDVLSGCQDLPFVPVDMIQALRLLQPSCSARQREIESIITQIRKYVMDRRSFSYKQGNFLRLVRSSDPDLKDDRIIYSSILASRRCDNVFLRVYESAERFGEVQAFAAMPPTPRRFNRSGWDVPPSDLRFLVSTFRGTLWLVDGEGRSVRLRIPDGGRLGHVRAFHFLRTRLVLSFSHGALRQLEVKWIEEAWKGENRPPKLIPLPELGQAEASALCFCAPPGAEEGEGNDCIWGDDRGRISAILSGRLHSLVDLSERILPITGSMQIHQIKQFRLRREEGDDLSMIAAGTIYGDIVLLRWQEGDSPRLSVVSAVRAGNSQVSSLVVAQNSDSSPWIIAANVEGLIAGFRVVRQAGANALDSPQLVLGWSWKAGDCVRSIRQLSLGRGPREESACHLLAGSHDEHLYLLDLEGRCLETYYQPGFKLDYFAVAPPSPEGHDFIEARVFAFAFENAFVGLRLVDRCKLIENMTDELGGKSPQERELCLTRWRSYPLVEGHLRHRFIRQSTRHPGSTPADAIVAIRRLLVRGQRPKSGRGLADRDPPLLLATSVTGELTALLRRLFQNRPPGQESDHEPNGGLRRILDSTELYEDVVLLLSELEEQWGAPGSLDNRRVQLFWIRSLLRNIDDLAMWKRWAEVGDQVGVSMQCAAHPAEIIDHFLDHPTDLVQIKVLQYLESLLYGGLPEDRGGILSGLEQADQASVELEWLIDRLLVRVWKAGDLISLQEPDPVILAIGRLFCAMLRRGHVDPLFLSRRMLDHLVPKEVFEILAHQSSALFERNAAEAVADPTADGDASPSFAEIFRTVAELAEPELEPSAEQIAQSLERLRLHCRKGTKGAGSAFLREASLYFETLIPLLKLENLDEIRLRLFDWKAPQGSFQFYRSLRLFHLFTPVVDAVKSYSECKYKDRYLEPVMEQLSFDDFDAVWRHWERVEAAAEDPHSSDLEDKLIRLLVSRWRMIFETERDHDLLNDFLEIVEEKCIKEPPSAPANTAQAAEFLEGESKLASAAFSNLFNRLLLFAEPERGAFLYLNRGDRSVRRWLFDRSWSPPLRKSSQESELPDWLDSGWVSPLRLVQLDVPAIYGWLHALPGDYCWKVEAIFGDHEDQVASDESELEEDPQLERNFEFDRSTTFGFYVFGWDDAEAPGAKRFVKQRLSWAVPLEALVFRQAAMQQEALKGRIFSMVSHNLGSPIYRMRSDLKVLVDGFLEDQPSKRKEKYAQLLRQARHLDGIIDSMLSLSKRALKMDWKIVALAKLVQEVVESMRREASTRNVQIDYARPTEKELAESQFLTDESKVYDILLNLISNAVKYSPRGKKIEITLGFNRQGANIEVRDEGPGIPEKERQMVFTAFYRGSRAVIEGKQGLGLGLYTVKLYTDSLQGRIQIADEAGSGAVLKLFLPRLEPSQLAEQFNANPVD